MQKKKKNPLNTAQILLCFTGRDSISSLKGQEKHYL